MPDIIAALDRNRANEITVCALALRHYATRLADAADAPEVDSQKLMAISQQATLVVTRISEILRTFTKDSQADHVS